MTEKTDWDPEHLDVAKQGAAAIDAWRREHPVGVLRLENANLGLANLARANLACANLAGANLAGANLACANLARVNLACAKLRDAGLADANLVHANLEDANLVRANLEDANLEAANLALANLGLANLAHANLARANLAGANLAGANLACANLARANLARANLRDADVRGANFAESAAGFTLFGTDLSGALGLETIDHRRPSRITDQALLRPKHGPLPIKFLRGIGLSDTEVDFVRAISTNPIEFYSAFISYHAHGADDKFAVRLHDQLQAKGIRCWLDKHEVLPGDDFLERINEGIRLWDKILLICSEQSLKSDWVQAEVERAFKKERELKKTHGPVKLIVPIDLDGYLFRDECDFKFTADLQARHAATMTGWEGDEAIFDAQFERTVKALRSDELARVPPPESKLKPREQSEE